MSDSVCVSRNGNVEDGKCVNIEMMQIRVRKVKGKKEVKEKIQAAQ